jgi:fused signal recognition particle receptor
MFSFFRKKPPAPPPAAAPSTTEAMSPPTPAQKPANIPELAPAATAPVLAPTPEPAPERKSWIDKLKAGLRKTGSSIATVFTGTQIDDALYEDLETALLMADTGVKATEYLLQDLKRRVKDSKTTDPSAVNAIMI